MASLVRSDLEVTKIQMDDVGRAIIFNAACCSWTNLNTPSGSTCEARLKPVAYFSRITLHHLVCRLAQPTAGGNMNLTFALQDSIKNQNHISPHAVILLAHEYGLTASACSTP